MAHAIPVDSTRIASLLTTLERMAAGESELSLPISDAHDELDAIAFAINVMGGELRYAEAARNDEHLRQKAAAEKASQAKSVFLRNVSHELRTPLAAIIAALDLAKTEMRPAQLEQLRRNSAALMSLLDGVLDFAKIEEDQLALNTGPLQVTELVEDILACFESTALQKGIGLKVASHNAEGWYWGDLGRLRQILLNLVGNAVKFTNQGSVTVHAEVVLCDQLSRLVCSVNDTGIGILPEYHELLFVPFMRGMATGNAYPGTGLGLALSRRIAEAMGGTLTLVASSPEHGSEFRLDVPLAPHAQPGVDESLPKKLPLAGLRVLLAEDNRDIRALYQAILEEEGAVVDTACDGAEALARGTATTYDVILLDIRMPDESGLVVMRQLRAQGIATPAVALTADVVAELRQACYAAGFDDFLAKPASFEQLVAKVHQHGSRKPIVPG